MSLSTIAVPTITTTPKTVNTNQFLEEEQLEVFHQWADSQGIERKVEVRQEPTCGRGLIATERIEASDVAARVPLQAVLRLEHDVEHDQDDNWAGILANQLHQESLMGQGHWAPYISTLPTEAPLTPCRWDHNGLLESLQNETFVELILENCDWRNRQLLRNVNDEDDDDDFLKWLDLVCSRTLKGRDGSRQLVPLIEIANHAPCEAGGGHFVVDDEAVYLIAGSRGVNPGQAVTLDYGARNVEDFLLHYGFVPHRCISDSVTTDDGVTIGWGDLQGYHGHSRKEVRQACAQMLSRFPTTLEEDVALWNHHQESSAASEAAIAYRYAKKSLLASAVGMQSSPARSAFAAL